QLRLGMLLQISLFTNNEGDRDALGWILKQYFITNYHLPLLDYTQTPPAQFPTGEFVFLKYHGDSPDKPGEGKLYQRDVTFECQARVLDATEAYQVQKIVYA